MANVPPELEDKFRRCKEHVMGQGHDESSAFAMCYSAVVEGKGEEAAKLGFVLTEAEKAEIIEYWTAKFGNSLPVKVAGDWELDVLAIPFDSTDSDGQWFDARTDIKAENYSTPLIGYQHGVSQGAKAIQDNPVSLGKVKPGSLEKKRDGWHVRVLLDKASKLAKAVWEAAQKGMAAVSSGSVAHYARLEVNGKLIPYEKNKAGRIAVWPLAEVSIWEKGNGNMNPANHYAVALPVMKAKYRDAGKAFPDISPQFNDDLAEAKSASRRAELERMEKTLSEIKSQLTKSGGRTR